MTPLSRRGFLGALLAAPVVLIAKLRRPPIADLLDTAPELEIWGPHSLHGLPAVDHINDGTIAPTYAGISRDTGLPAYSVTRFSEFSVVKYHPLGKC